MRAVLVARACGSQVRSICRTDCSVWRDFGAWRDGCRLGSACRSKSDGLLAGPRRRWGWHCSTGRRSSPRHCTAQSRRSMTPSARSGATGCAGVARARLAPPLRWSRARRRPGRDRRGLGRTPAREGDRRAGHEDQHGCRDGPRTACRGRGLARSLTLRGHRKSSAPRPGGRPREPSVHRHRPRPSATGCARRREGPRSVRARLLAVFVAVAAAAPVTVGAAAPAGDEGLRDLPDRHRDPVERF